MTGAERSLRRLDPLGSLAGRPLTLLGAVSAPVVALLSTLATAPRAGVPVAAVIALALISLAGLVLAVRSSPHRSPAGRGTAFTVLGLALGASVASATAYWSVKGIGADWAPIATALLVLALSTYRPAREIIVLGVLGSAGLVAIALVQGGSDSLSVMVNAVAAVTPVLALALGGAAFASTVVRNLETWQVEERSATGAEVKRLRSSGGDDGRADRVGILNREVAPLFASILSAGTVTRAEQARATALADSLRRVMVLEADRSWLDELIVGLPAADEFSDASVIDDQRLAETMSIEMRAAARAVIVALAQPGVSDPGTLQIVMQAQGNRADVSISADSMDGAPSLPHLLEPYATVLATLFDDVAVDIAPPAVTLRFSYDRP